ncbi:pyridoxal phosphate-dependent transferase [Lactifluus subvellereus]|nr:pyridoxal phosphate-dependent transferase [Lactifluus subvellereus]
MSGSSLSHSTHLPPINTGPNVQKLYKHEDESPAHQIFRQAPGHKSKHAQVILPQTVNPDEETIPGIQHPGSTGVIYCSDRAQAHGFNYASSHEWSNLGQGAPEVGPIPDAPDRPLKVEYNFDALEYAPTTGVKGLREAVAHLYNTTYRRGRASQYTYENVCIVPGGRAGLSRVAAVIGDVYCSYQVPDYTAYDQMLSAFKRLVPVPTALEPEHHYNLDIGQVKKDIRTQGLSVIVASNPRNPTGQVIRGEALEELVAISRESTVTLILDEFYSWYIYHEDGKDIGRSISSAEYIEDVNRDSVIIVDGLTKNWRLPGWRICWVVGPKNLITALSQSGSFLDGGANHP